MGLGAKSRFEICRRPSASKGGKKKGRERGSFNASISTHALFLPLDLSLSTPFSPPLPSLPRPPPTRTGAITAAERGRTSLHRNNAEAATQLLLLLPERRRRRNRRRRRRRNCRRRGCRIMIPPPITASPLPNSTRCRGRTSSGAARAGCWRAACPNCPPASKESSQPMLLEPEMPPPQPLGLLDLLLLLFLLILHLVRPSCRRP